MLEALRTGDWEAPIFSHERAPEMAYGLFRAGKISEGQFVTHQFFWAARTEYKEALGFFPMLDGGGLTSRARALLDLPRGLTEAAKEQLAAKLAALPRSEQYVLQASTHEALQADPRLGVADATFRAFLGMHFRPPEGQAWGLVVPSFGLMQLYLEARYEERAMQAVPEFGIAPHESILDQIGQHRRVVVVPYPGIDGVEEGDGMYFGKTYGFLHDFYHLDRGSSIVIPEYRVLFPLIFSAMLRHKREFQTAPGEYVWVWQETIDGLMNLETDSRELLTYGPPPSALDCFEVDFGRNSRRSLVGQVVLRDMLERRGMWEALGVDIPAWERRLK